MSTDIVQQRLLTYQSQNLTEQENALKEIALMALSRAGFFSVTAFQGGTCLRILYGLNRFSEDLDFVLNIPDKKFTWQPYIKSMTEEFKAYVTSQPLKMCMNISKTAHASWSSSKSQ